jgi:N-methylhydantoinase B
MLFAPVFQGDVLVAIVGSVGHQVDVGGRSPGSYAGDVTEIYQEGLCLPPLKLYARGVPNEAVHAILAANVREPAKTLGDVRALVAALQIGQRRLLELVAKYGVATIEACVDELIAYAERRMRARLAAIPDGDYAFEDLVDDDGIDPAPIRIAVALRVRGSDVTVDFTGTAAQRKAPINATLASTRSAVYFAFMSALDAAGLANSGSYAPFDIVSPPGTVVNAQHPAPVTGRMAISHRVVTTIYGALAQAMPERSTAAFYGMSNICTVGGTHPDGRAWVFFEINPGGWGGRSGKDGLDCHSFGLHNIANTPVEMAETMFPVWFERYELLADSGGQGQYRGGLGVRREFRLLTEGVFTAQADRFRVAPHGVLGGGPGRPGRHLVVSADETISLPSKVTNYPLRAGDVVRIETQGGGGWGPPERRAPAASEADRRAGKTTAGASGEPAPPSSPSAC